MNDDHGEQIREQMAAIRGALRQDVETIAVNAKLVADWRHHYRKHPAWFAAAAAVVGYSIIPHRKPASMNGAGPAQSNGYQHAAQIPPQSKQKDSLVQEVVRGFVLPTLFKVGMNGIVQQLKAGADRNSDSPTESQPAPHPIFRSEEAR